MLYADACDVGEKIVSENWPLVYQSCVKKYPDPCEILYIHIYRESSKADRSNILFHYSFSTFLLLHFYSKLLSSKLFKFVEKDIIYIRTI